MTRSHPYSSSELLRSVAQLGREFANRGLTQEADSLRIYYWAIRNGHVGHAGDIRVVWSPDRVLTWMKILRLPPYQGFFRVLPMNTPSCPGCTRARMTMKVEVSCGPIRQVRCRVCNETWVEEFLPHNSTGGRDDVH